MFNQADDVIALLQDAMMKESLPTNSLSDKAAKRDIVNKGLTVAGASLLASELVLGDGVDDKKGGVTLTKRVGSAGVGDGSDQGFTSSCNREEGTGIHVHVYVTEL